MVQGQHKVSVQDGQQRGAESGSDSVAVSVVRDGYASGAPLPWPMKMVLKIVLAQLRFSYGFWARLGIYRHGDLTQDLSGLQQSFLDHLSYYRERTGGMVPGYCLELGPGDSIGHVLIAKSVGVGGMWLNDVGDFASRDSTHYQALYERLRQNGNDFGQNLACFDRDSVLEFCGATYGTEGLRSLQDVPDAVVDFSFSHAVLEHVRREEFSAHMKELYRVHKPGSVSRHWVDLHDHLGGALNSMRFSSPFWEGALVGKAGFYTNRLTMNEMVSMAEDAGFEVEILQIHKWKTLPTPRGAMHDFFSRKSEEELNVCTFLFVLKKP